MAARLCTTCGIQYPPAHKECDACGLSMKWVGSAEADPDWQLKVELVRESSPATLQLRRWRHRELTRMGFEGAFLEPLVETTSIGLHDISDLLDVGCPHDVAAKILL